MIKFIKKDTLYYQITKDDQAILDVELEKGTLSNSFDKITEFITQLSSSISEFDEWFVSFIREYSSKNDQERFEYFYDKIPELKEFVFKYISSLGIDFESFIDRSRVKKTTILFLPEEIEKIIKISSLLKFYSIFKCSKDYSLSRFHSSIIFNKLIQDLVDDGIILKIYDVIKSKFFRYSISDKMMWEYIKRVRNKTLDVHVVETFNFILETILVLCQPNKNPITFLSVVVDESVKWTLRSVYRETILYESDICNTKIHEYVQTNNLEQYCYDETISRLRKLSVKQILQHFSDDLEKNNIDFEKNLDKIRSISPLTECVTFPILSSILSVPYQHFMKMTPSHAALLSGYVGILLSSLDSNDDGDYKTIGTLLLYYPSSDSRVLTSTYRIRYLQDFLISQKDSNFYGFKSKILPLKVISHFVGRFVRTELNHLITNEPLVSKPVRRVEEELTRLISKFTSNSISKDHIFREIEKRIIKSF